MYSKEYTLNTCRDDEDEGGGIHAHPVVAEAAGQLLQSGVNTLQRTLLLRRQVSRKKSHPI